MNIAERWPSFMRDRVIPHFSFLLKASKAEKIKAGVIAGLIGTFGLMFNTQFGVFLDVAETRCMPEYIYLGYPKVGQINKGDVVSFRANSRQMFDLMTGKRIAKIVAGTAGDHVVSNQDGVFVNGTFIAKRNSISLQNLSAKGMQPVNLDKVLAEGELFVIGTLPRSFDSRYWGVLPESSVDRFIKPIL